MRDGIDRIDVRPPCEIEPLAGGRDGGAAVIRAEDVGRTAAWRRPQALEPAWRDPARAARGGPRVPPRARDAPRHRARVESPERTLVPDHRRCGARRSAR